MNDELPILEGEVIEDEAPAAPVTDDLDPESFFTPSPVPAPVVQRPERPAPGDPAQDPSHPEYVPDSYPLSLRKGTQHVSQAQTENRADRVYELHMDGMRVREIAARSVELIGVPLGKSRVGELLQLGTARYDAATAAERERGIARSEAELNWAQGKAKRALTQMATLFSEQGTVEVVAKAIAANPEMAGEILANVINSGKSVIDGAKAYVDGEHKRTEWLGTRAPKRTENKNLNMNLNGELTQAAAETVASNPIIEGMRQRAALTATRQEDPMPDLSGALHEGSAAGHR